MYTCIPLHRLKRSWHSCPRWVNAGNKNTPRMHLPQRQNVTTSMVGLRIGHLRKNLTQNGEPQRQSISWGTRRRRKWPQTMSHDVSWLGKCCMKFHAARSVFVFLIIRQGFVGLCVARDLRGKRKKWAERCSVTHTHAYALACTLTHNYINIYKRRLACMGAPTYTLTNTCTHTHILTYIHTYTLAHKHRYICQCTCLLIHIWICVIICAIYGSL